MNDDSRWQHSSQVHNGLQALTEFGMLGSRDWLILLFGMQLRRDRGPTLLAEAASGPCTTAPDLRLLGSGLFHMPRTMGSTAVSWGALGPGLCTCRSCSQVRFGRTGAHRPEQWERYATNSQGTLSEGVGRMPATQSWS